MQEARVNDRTGQVELQFKAPQEDQADNNTLPASFYNLKREYVPSKDWDLTGQSSKINNVDDVAYLMRALETKAVEHTFAVFNNDAGYHVSSILVVMGFIPLESKIM